MGDPRDHYRAMLRSSDPLEREVARRQLDRLQQAPQPRPDASPPGRWAHVPLAELFERAGNTIRRRHNGSAECGHEPFHGSRSGRCVAIDERLGLWYCRFCRRGGDAARIVMDLNGWPYREAAAWLARRYGTPANEAGQARPGRHGRWVEA